MDNPYWGYPSSFLAIEGLTVQDGGIIEGLVPFQHDNFWDSFLNVPISLEIRFISSSVPHSVENREEIIAFYGENGENFEGPFVVEEWHSNDEEPSYFVAATIITEARLDETHKIVEPTFGTPPSDQGDTDVWMEAEIVDIDHHHIHVKGRSNLHYGTLIQGGLGGEWIFRQAFFDQTIVRKDGTFSLPISYKDITKVEYLRIFVEPKYGHKRGKVINETYGEKFEHVQGDLVKPISQYYDTQMIELRIPLKHEYEETPDDVEVTLDGDEMKFILSDEILFDFNKSEVKPEGKRVIEEVVDWLEKEDYKV